VVGVCGSLHDTKQCRCVLRAYRKTLDTLAFSIQRIENKNKYPRIFISKPSPKPSKPSKAKTRLLIEVLFSWFAQPFCIFSALDGALALSAAHQAQLLLRMRDCHRRGESIPAADLAEFFAKLDRYFSQRCSLDEAFGVRLDVGESHPGGTLLMAVRDAELGTAAVKFGIICFANSKQLSAMMESYELGPWQRERTLETCPAHRCGRIEGHFWRALKAWPRVVKARQMHLIVAAQRLVKSASDCTESGPYPDGSKIDRKTGGVS
jgi:hypothetical protein